MTKKQIIQLAVLGLCLYLGVFFMMAPDPNYYEYYDMFGLITLLALLGVYVIYSQRNNKFMRYFRILLYVILVFLIVRFFDLYIFYGYTSGLYTSSVSNPFKHLIMVLLNFRPIYMILITGVLLLNKPVAAKTLKLGRLKISF